MMIIVYPLYKKKLDKYDYFFKKEKKYSAAINFVERKKKC
jgi:hypothetical protein